MCCPFSDPERDQCFGTGFKHWMLETFFGYDDLVMGSIKNLAEKTNKDGGGRLYHMPSSIESIMPLTINHQDFFVIW